MMRLQDITPEERPRERLLNVGPSALSDAELLAILLRTGTRDQPIVDLCRSLLRSFGSLSGLLHAEPHDLVQTKGLGEAKVASLLCVRELARRMTLETLKRGQSLQTPQAARDLLQIELAGLPHEVFSVVYLDTQHRYLNHETLFRGTLTQTSVHPREVIKRALGLNAAAIIVAHNHPSGLAEPSSADRHLTQALKNALNMVDIKLLDHFVIAGADAFSFAERGYL